MPISDINQHTKWKPKSKGNVQSSTNPSKTFTWRDEVPSHGKACSNRKKCRLLCTYIYWSIFTYANYSFPPTTLHILEQPVANSNNPCQEANGLRINWTKTRVEGVRNRKKVNQQPYLHRSPMVKASTMHKLLSTFAHAWCYQFISCHICCKVQSNIPLNIISSLQ